MKDEKVSCPLLLLLLLTNNLIVVTLVPTNTSICMKVMNAAFCVNKRKMTQDIHAKMKTILISPVQHGINRP